MKLDKKTVLHIGAGKVDCADIHNGDGAFHVYLDRGYPFTCTMRDVMDSLVKWQADVINGVHPTVGGSSHFIPADIFEFLDQFPFQFDHIEAYRIFEHQEYCSGEIGRLFEACNNISKDNSTLDILVPNAEILATLLLECEKDLEYSLNNMLVLNSEFCNIKADPHGSIWTPRLAEIYLHQEATWELHNIQSAHHHKGRDYMKIECFKGMGNKEWIQE